MSYAHDELPDVRDGLSRLERVISATGFALGLWQLDLARRELGRASVPTALLYGRVVEHVDVSVARFQAALARLVGHGEA